MHDKIKALLPKEKELPYPNSGILGMGGNIKQFDETTGYNKAIREVHAKIPEIVALVEGEVREEERQFILNILDGIDIADEQMQNKSGGTKAIRLALASRSPRRTR